MSNQTRSYWKGGVHSFYDEGLNTAVHKGGVWATCPLNAIRCNPSLAHVIHEDFNDVQAATLAGYTATQATAGTFALTDEVGGVALLDSNSTTATQGINVQKLGECILPAASKDIWFECRFKIVDTYDKCELFAGLAITDTSIISGSDMTASDHIGWECHTDDGIILFGAEKAGTEATPLASTTITEAAYFKFAFHVKGVTSVDHWVNDAKLTTTHLTANIPVVEITPSFVCQSGGTNDPIMHLDYYTCVQIR